MHALQPVQSVGRFTLVRHTGHTSDAAGVVVALGATLAETPQADNYFTREGSAFWASVGPNQVSVGVSTSGVAPSAGRIGASVRTSNVLVSSATSRSLVPDESGRVWWRKTYRFSFAASPGLPTVKLRQASASVSGGPLFGGMTSGVVSAALIPGPTGEPTSVIVDMSSESFDIVWEYTEYFKPEMTGSFVVRTADGSGNTLDLTNHTFILRPCNLNNTSDASKGWAELANSQFPYLSAATGDIKLGVGTLGFAGSEPTFSEVVNPASIVHPTLILGSTEFIVRMNLGFDETTPSTHINCAQFMLGHSEWQISFDPPVIKKARHRSSFYFGIITK